MEVRLDRLDRSEPPEDTFVSLRIGDVQKQSRLVGTRQFRFPEYVGSSRSVGRIEVFKRLGWINVNIGGARGCHYETQDVEIPVDLPNLTNLPLRISAQGPPEEEEHLSNDALISGRCKKTTKERLDVAHRYINKHRLEEILADVMREVIEQKPGDPHSYISGRILELAAEKGVRVAQADPKAKAYEVLRRSNLGGLLAKRIKKKRTEATFAPPPMMKQVPHTEFVEEVPLHKNVRRYNYGKVPEVDLAEQARLRARQVLEEALSRFIETEALEDPAMNNAKRGARQALEAALEELSNLLPQEVLERARCALDAALHNEGVRHTAATKIQAHMRGKVSRQRLEEVKQEARDVLDATLREEAQGFMMSSSADGSLGRTLKEISMQEEARDAMMSASKSGNLHRAVQEVHLQEQAQSMLIRAGSDGRLATAFHELESRRQAEIRSCQRFVKGQLLQAINDGSIDISMKDFIAKGRRNPTSKFDTDYKKGLCNPTATLDADYKKVARTSLAQAGFDGRLVAAVDAARALGPGAAIEEVRTAVHTSLSQEPRSRSDTPCPRPETPLR
mmetsp:Transcript_108350/g.209755  ORF Transcript_108350/g.209755 Transcript_108350/m.209755 type:complete len:563 (+) Transcript_108350:89-1777(+)